MTLHPSSSPSPSASPQDATIAAPSASEKVTPPKIGESLERLLCLLVERGYTTKSVHDVLGEEGIGAAATGSPQAALWHARRGTNKAASDSSNPDTAACEDIPDLLCAFYLREPLPRGRFDQLLGAELTADLINDGVLGGMRSQVDIRPISVAAHGVEDVLIASDPDASMEDHVPGATHVPGVGNAPLSLLGTIPPIEDGTSILDLGCGSGVLSLVLGTSANDVRVVGTDISSRALDFARVNGSAVASGKKTDFTWKQGSWFDPVAGQTFDRLVANPPFVIGPAQVGHVYRDSGLALDGATQLVVEGAREHLNDGGTAHILAGWALTEDQSAAQRVSSWLPSHGVRAWALEREIVDPATYVTTWLKDESIDPRHPDGRARTQEWLDYFAEHNVTHIGLGFIHLQRVAEEIPTELTVEKLDRPLPPGTYLGTEVSEHFARTHWLADQDRESILSSRYALRPTCALERVLLPSSNDATSDGFQPFVQRLSRTDGPAWSHEVDEALIRVLAGLHPSALPMADVAELYCAVNGVDSEEFLEALAPLAVDLVRHGMIIPAALLDE